MSYSVDTIGNNGSGQEPYAPGPNRNADPNVAMFERQIEALLQQLQARDGTSRDPAENGFPDGASGSAPPAAGAGQAPATSQVLEQVAEALLQALRDRPATSGPDATGGSGSGSPAIAAAEGGAPSGAPTADRMAAAPSGPAQPAAAADPSAPASGAAQAATVSGSSAGSGPNAIQITNTTSQPMTLGKFENGQSTTDPSAQITLQPGQTGTIRYQNGEAGFVSKADSSGAFQPTASRLEYEADADGKQKYPDVSYIDGRNASISLTDGASLHKGDTASIAAGAPAGTVTTDAAGNKTIAGYYDGSSATMQAGADYMQSQLGTGNAYLHPNDDRLAAGQNPMSSTQSNTIYADFGNA